MASVILFHSVYGLRHMEHAAAELLRAAGHDVFLPDLFAGQTADTIGHGFDLMESIGWPRICAQAEKAINELPADTVLAGISMGAGVVGSLWPHKVDARGILLLHGLATIPETARRSLPVQVHLAGPDAFVSGDQKAAWEENAVRRGLSVEMFEYPGAGHFFTDNLLQDYDAAATTETWSRALTFLETLSN